ncbi:MAG: lysylphosphatidylglycerol synthase transmembrane domain-containing protein [Nitrospirae bacterium]|nr:lysylphosphatidylglycerol synthase transmembrane domain-containing protein [Nitrospirota bacterium]
MARKLNKIRFFILKLVVSSSLLYFVLSNTGVEKVFAIIRTINPFAFTGAIFIYIASLYVSSIRWRLLLPEEFKGKRLFSFYLIGSFFNTFLPGIVGGDAVKTYYLYKETNKGSLSFASVFMDRYMGFISLMTIALISFAAGFKYVKGSLIEWLLPTIVLSFLIGSFAIFRLRLGKGIKALSEFYGYFNEYSHQKMVIMKTLMLSFTIQVLSILSMYIIALGLGQHIYLSYFFIFFPIIVTISTLPISISGIGLREGAFVLLFGMAGVKPEMATAMSFAWFLSIASGGLVGLFEYLRLKT